MLNIVEIGLLVCQPLQINMATMQFLSYVHIVQPSENTKFKYKMQYKNDVYRNSMLRALYDAVLYECQNKYLSANKITV